MVHGQLPKLIGKLTAGTKLNLTSMKGIAMAVSFLFWIWEFQVLTWFVLKHKTLKTI